MKSFVIEIKDYLLDLQQRICGFLEAEDKYAVFSSDPWSHQQGGGGMTKVLANGKVLEKAGVNFSHVFGTELPAAATLKRPGLKGSTFEALGVSVVVHPINPYVPTTHLNVRYVAVTKTDGSCHWWFGGGFDLTPYYGFIEDCLHWHLTANKACHDFGEDVYPRYKKWCDDYFYLKHRHEQRGIGGLFFDDLNEWGFQPSFQFMQSVGNHFIEAYQPIIARRKRHPYGERERAFQCYRRGRYVEFNLLYDRGTLFGIQSNGRIESILMSLPPTVHWKYNWQPEMASAEEALTQQYLIVRDWI